MSPLVAEVLRAPGDPLEASTRHVAEASFGRDFGAVRIHSDGLAARAAHDVGAAAFTSGNDVVCGRGRYPPHGIGGLLLLSHELAHVVQAGAPPDDRTLPERIGDPEALEERDAGRAAQWPDWGAVERSLELRPRILRRTPDELVEVELEPVSPAESERLRQQGIRLPVVGSSTWAAVGGMPYSSIMPRYSQEGDTCGAASLVTALMIWDREHWDPAEPNSRVVTACNLILSAMDSHGDLAVSRWAARPSPEVRKLCVGEAAGCPTLAYQIVRGNLVRDLQRIRDAARRPGAQIPEADYQRLGQTLYFLWHEGGDAGLSTSQIDDIQRTLGLAAGDPRGTSGIQSFAEIFSDPIIVGLGPDEFAQVAWFVTTGRQHIVLIGRLATGEWFLSDQGTTPATEFRASSLADLHSAVRTAAMGGSYWLYTGTSLEYMRRTGLIPGWTGVRRLADAGGPGRRAQEIVPAGAFLGEVDAGWLTIGSRISRVDFVGTRYSLADAQALFIASRGGGLVVEQPAGVFSLYSTTTVSSANLAETSLDAADSAGGVLASRSFKAAWLMLATSDGRHGAWFRVY